METKNDVEVEIFLTGGHSLSGWISSENLHLIAKLMKQPETKETIGMISFVDSVAHSTIVAVRYIAAIRYRIGE